MRHRHRRLARSAAALVLLLASLGALAPGRARAGDPALFVDPTDGGFDLSTWLATRNGFVPLLVPITEPAVGYGAAGGVVYFHPRSGPAPDAGVPRKSPPSLSAAMAFGTSNGSWGAGGGHMGVWREDSIRYLGGAAYASLNLDYFGASGVARRFRIESVPIIQELVFRLGDSRLYAGGRWVYARSRVRFEDAPPGGLLGAESVTATSGLGPVVTYDARDTVFTPSSGTRAEASFLWYDPVLGGDFRYWKLGVYQLSYFPLTPSLTGALRLDAKLSGGDVPFYALPFVRLRGVPALRYQGRLAAVAETELRWDFLRRWSAVGFGGVGMVDTNPDDVAWSVGVGGRYLVARAFGLRMGVDVARGPETWACYVVFGNAWR